MTKKPKVTAADIRAALRLHFPDGAHAVLEEVRNGTGYRRSERYADALVCSCWPSRGLWLAGVEIKVSRSDWRKELEQPNKSAEIQKWCDYWWIAAPKGLVKDGELPVTWGLLEYDPKERTKSKIVVAVQAPKLEAQPLSIEFMTTQLAQAQSRIRLLEHYESLCAQDLGASSDASCLEDREPADDELDAIEADEHFIDGECDCKDRPTKGLRIERAVEEFLALERQLKALDMRREQLLEELKELV